jgi:hypothetical protein
MPPVKVKAAADAKNFRREQRKLRSRMEGPDCEYHGPIKRIPNNIYAWCYRPELEPTSKGNFRKHLRLKELRESLMPSWWRLS